MKTSKAKKFHPNWHDFVDVSSQNLLSRLEKAGVPVEKRVAKGDAFGLPDFGIDGGDYVKPRLNSAKAPLWAIAIMCSDLHEAEAHVVVRRCLDEPESLAAIITLFVVLDGEHEWTPREAASAVREVFPTQTPLTLEPRED